MVHYLEHSGNNQETDCLQITEVRGEGWRTWEGLEGCEDVGGDVRMEDVGGARGMVEESERMVWWWTEGACFQGQ